VRLVAQADQLALQVEGWPPIAVLPVDERRAIAHYEPFTCTWLVREGDAFRLRIESTEFRLERRPP
jgi:hypothetical protein